MTYNTRGGLGNYTCTHEPAQVLLFLVCFSVVKNTNRFEDLDKLSSMQTIEPCSFSHQIDYGFQKNNFVTIGSLFLRTLLIKHKLFKKNMQEKISQR